MGDSDSKKACFSLNAEQFWIFRMKSESEFYLNAEIVEMWYDNNDTSFESTRTLFTQLHSNIIIVTIIIIIHCPWREVVDFLDSDCENENNKFAVNFIFPVWLPSTPPLHHHHHHQSCNKNVIQPGGLEWVWVRVPI